MKEMMQKLAESQNNAAVHALTQNKLAELAAQVAMLTERLNNLEQLVTNGKPSTSARSAK